MSKYSVTLEKIGTYENTYVPQANDLNKIALIIDVLRKSWINEKDIALALSFSDRQSMYYADALRFLDLIDSFEYGKNTMIGLNNDAYKYFEKGDVKKNLRKHILDGMYIERYETRLNKRSNIGEDTQKRRKQSLEAWKRWVNE